MAAVASCVLAAGVALSGCSATASGTVAAGSSGSAPAASSAPAVSAAPVASTAPAGGSGSAPAGVSTPAASPAPVAAGAARCTTANLGFTDGPDNGPQAVGDTEAARVVKLTNRGGSSCTLYGFPGVDLKTNAGTLSVSRSKKSSQRITLKPGGSALITITYPVNTGGGSGIRVDSMVITPPGETHSHTMAWAEGSFPVEDGSGHSVLEVDPVTSFSG
ncbi:DUF4232 domain-containing protein [Streptacidiphilus sp. N1-3]|uniref:DUF4232 domain-containing protein n=1 Tax=Streptacidiphilus alkalitolerans TaxID=3342712 RepID=A0ABV6X536_9ACTN